MTAFSRSCSYHVGTFAGWAGWSQEFVKVGKSLQKCILISYKIKENLYYRSLQQRLLFYDEKVDAKLGSQLFKWQLFLSANVSTTPPSELSAARGKSGLNSTLLHWVFKSLAKALFAQGVHSLGKPKHFHHFVTFTPNINTNQTVCCLFSALCRIESWV